MARPIAFVALYALLARTPVAAAGAPRLDKCMKHLWSGVVDDCGGAVAYHGACEVRVENLSTYGASCDAYCASFGFECAGGRTAAGARGCQVDDSAYLSCSDRAAGDAAICSCRDPQDTFLWQGAERICGPGRAQVLAATAITCGDYCSAQGLACAGASEVSDGACGAGASRGCAAKLAEQGSAICECAGAFDRSGAYLWPDKLELCASSTVLVSGQALTRHNGTCSGYCEDLRRMVPGFDLYFTCFGAWAARDAGCGAYSSGQRRLRGLAASSAFEACSLSFDGGDAVCACSFADL